MLSRLASTAFQPASMERKCCIPIAWQVQHQTWPAKHEPTNLEQVLAGRKSAIRRWIDGVGERCRRRHTGIRTRWQLQDGLAAPISFGRRCNGQQKEQKNFQMGRHLLQVSRSQVLGPAQNAQKPWCGQLKPWHRVQFDICLPSEKRQRWLHATAWA